MENLKINLIETITKDGDITRARRIYLRSQIRILENQKTEILKEIPGDLQSGEGLSVLLQPDYIPRIAFIGFLDVYIDMYKLELFNLRDVEDQFNA